MTGDTRPAGSLSAGSLSAGSLSAGSLSAGIRRMPLSWRQSAIPPQPVVAVRQPADAKVDFCHSGTVSTKTYGVDAPAMSLGLHGWDIHAVSAEPDRMAAGNHWSLE